MVESRQEELKLLNGILETLQMILFKISDMEEKLSKELQKK